MLTAHTRQLRVVRPGRALIYPGPQHANLFRRESFTLRRHDFVRLQSGDEPHQPAFRAPAWHNDLAVIAALERSRFRVEAQSALLLLRPVTFETMICEDGSHLADKVQIAGSGCERS